MITAILIVIFILIKQRSKNGFWSRENDLKTKAPSKTFKCFSIYNTESTIEHNKPPNNLELKRCKNTAKSIENERYLNPITIDEYLTNSLYGTINRLISNQNSTCMSLSSDESGHRTCSIGRNLNNIEGPMRNSTSYILPHEESDSTEIHF